MTTASTSSSYGSPEEKTNGFKLMRLIVDLGTEALRNEFSKIHTGNLHTVLGIHQPTLNRLKTRNIITQPQWDKLYPPVPMIPDIKGFDITLLVILLRNICGTSAPIGTGWNNMPNDTDTCLGANIVRVKIFRNEFFGHIPETGVSTTEFEARWKEVSTTLVHLGISQADIDRLKDEECGVEEVDRIRRELSEKDTRVALQLLGLKKVCAENQKVLEDIQSKLEVKAEKTLSKELNLEKYLVVCNFDSDIELMNQKWCEGTREWVFYEVNNWFNDTTSDSRAFIITGQAGMGKSVIAAVICKRYSKQLAASHFCQYNNNRYDNPKTLLKSLAAQVSNVIPEYKKALLEKLSGEEGKSLNNMNIQALFSLLLKEPLTGIEVAEKHLIVIDAVDECQHKGKSDLVDLIANYLCQLPSFIRFIITSRPENAIDKKFKKLKPIVLSRNDEQNVRDIHVFFEEKLAGLEEAKHIGKLIKKSDGLMLVANFLYQFLKDSCSSQFDIDDLPTGIEEVYESHFRRLKKELEILKVSEDNLLSFLSAVAVAREPLPIALFERLFCSDDDPPAISRVKTNMIKNCLSTLLVINEDRVSFLHKSVKDWLVGSDHEFTAAEKVGHDTLANICAKEMDEVKRNGIKRPFHPASQYALLHGIHHKMAGTQDKPLKSFINSYVTDLEIMYACVVIDVYELFNNIVSLKNNTIYSSLPDETRNSVETLMLLIRKYICSLKQFPDSFLHCVLNRGGSEFSSKADFLLKSRYKEQVYFELTGKDDLDDSVVGRFHLSGKLVGFDISPSQDHLICGYDDGRLELVSLVNFKSLWTIAFRRSHVLRQLYVFHPLKSVILPGRLDRVINLNGKYEAGPFLCEDINPRFYNCCFSNDKKRMATTYEKVLTVWSLVNNEKLMSFSTKEWLRSVMFSANGRFLAILDFKHAFVVYDIEKDFLSMSMKLDASAEIYAAFEEESWILRMGGKWLTIKSDLSQVDFYPANVMYDTYMPLNVKAVAEFEGAIKNPEKSWLTKFPDEIDFFCLDNGIAVVWQSSCSSRVLSFFRISRLKEALSMKDPLEDAVDIDISVDGKFIYAKHYSSLSIHEVDRNLSILSGSDRTWSGVPFSPVTNGVFFCDSSTVSYYDPELPNDRCLPDIPELWNSDLTEHLDSFPELSGTKDCQPVSKEIVACVMDGKVCFLDVVKRKVIAETCVPRNEKVSACSSMFHVLTRKEFSKTPPSLWQAGEVVAEELKEVSDELWIGWGGFDTECSFSPGSKTLVLKPYKSNYLYIYNVSPTKLRFKIYFEFFMELPSDNGPSMFFLDENHLLCRIVSRAFFCVVDVTSGNVLSTIDCDGVPKSCCVSRSLDNSSVLLCVKTDEKTALFKVWLPRQT